MAYVGQTLAAGYVQSFKALFYTATASTIIKHIHFWNTIGTSETVTVYHKSADSTDSPPWLSSSVAANDDWLPFTGDSDLPISSGDKIYIESTTENAVYCRIFGAKFE